MTFEELVEVLEKEFDTSVVQPATLYMRIVELAEEHNVLVNRILFSVGHTYEEFIGEYYYGAHETLFEEDYDEFTIATFPKDLINNQFEVYAIYELEDNEIIIELAKINF